MMKRVVLLTGHVWESKRKAGFHWIANEYIKKGYEVLFITTPVSLISKINNNYLFDIINKKKSRKIIKEKDIFQYINKTFFHVPSFRNPFIDALTTPFCLAYKKMLHDSELLSFVSDADVFVFESNYALYYFDLFKQVNKKAKFIYRVSDDIKFIKLHPHLIRHESKILQKFDLVSVPCEFLRKVLLSRSEVNNFNIRVDYHGIDKNRFLQKYENPFNPDERKNVVFVGNSHFDYQFLNAASKNFKNFMFHIIGPLEKKITRKNIVYYGEMPFDNTIAYIKYSDICLQTRSFAPGSESLTDSLKVLQYTFCDKAIVAPTFLKTARKNTFCYEVGQEKSIINAINNASCFTGSNDWKNINDWKILADNLECTS